MPHSYLWFTYKMTDGIFSQKKKRSTNEALPDWKRHSVQTHIPPVTPSPLQAKGRQSGKVLKTTLEAPLWQRCHGFEQFPHQHLTQIKRNAADYKPPSVTVRQSAARLVPKTPKSSLRVTFQKSDVITRRCVTCQPGKKKSFVSSYHPSRHLETRKDRKPMKRDNYRRRVVRASDGARIAV